jgi:hypothetical protein
MFMPLFIARMSAFWIVGTSAIGSEKGIPNSRISAPASTAVLTIARLVSKSGSPITKNRYCLRVQLALLADKVRQGMRAFQGGQYSLAFSQYPECVEHLIVFGRYVFRSVRIF